MAQSPIQEHIDEVKAETQAAIDEKIKIQQEKGKDFSVPEDGSGPGVIPEAQWKLMKARS